MTTPGRLSQIVDSQTDLQSSSPQSTWTQPVLAVRPAERHHAAAISRLINSWAEQHLMLRRDAREVRSIIKQFHVALASDHPDSSRNVVGCGALTPYSAQVAEIRSLCVDQSYHGGGVGTAVTNSLVQAARDKGHTRVLAVTKSPAFFTRLGFSIITPELYPAEFLDAGIRAHKRTLKNKYVVAIDVA